MNKLIATVAVGALAALATPGIAGAKGGGPRVSAKGVCSGSSSSTLSAKSDDRRIETEFEVDQNVGGDKWTVTISDNGTEVAHAHKTTSGPSDSFTVRKRIANVAGSDMVTASATDQQTGETCTATVTL